MKKTIALILTCCMILSIAVCFSGCNVLNIFKTKIDSGTEAAQLLLANERLDEHLIGQKIDIGLSSTDARSLAVPDTTVVTHTGSRTTTFEDFIFLNTSAAQETTHTWSEFPASSPSMVEFTQFMKSVEFEAEQVAEEIANMKNNVGVVDKWVRVGSELQMLCVFASCDVLLVKGIYDDIHVYYRYTDEETAKNVYEMYSFMKYDDGTTGDIRTMLIPGERCEYMYENSGGFSDYFIAENSRGYWIATRFNYHEDPESDYRSISLAPLIIKDGIGYGAFLQLDSIQSPNGLKNAWYTVFDPNLNRELFRIIENPSSYSFELYYSAIKDGLVSVSATDVRHDAEDDVYQTDSVSKMVTSTGSYNIANDINGAFTFSGGYVQYDYGSEFYLGNLVFNMAEPQISLDEACTELGSYVNGLGLELHCNMDTITKSIEHASLLAENFMDMFEWNGYKMSSFENVEKALDALDEQYDMGRQMYNTVKDYEVVSSRQMLSSSAHFAPLTIDGMGNNTFNGNEIVISGLSATTNDTALFEDGMDYVLMVGLSLMDENGKPISVNTIPLHDMPGAGTPYAGGSITLSNSGSYTVPKNLDSGRYAVIAYMATMKDGIRVSDMAKIGFVEITEGEIESSAMHMEATREDDHLIITYAIKNIHRIKLVADRDSYSPDVIRQAMMREVIAYGAPYHGAVLELENGEAVSEDAALTPGNTYRLMCYLQTDDGLAQSYVYLTIE